MAPIGYNLLMEVQGYAGFGIRLPEGPLANFWIHQGDNPTQHLHFAFTVKNRQTVDAFYQAALAAGGQCNGKPGVRDHYHPNYYGAFILDFDGRNLEVVCHAQEMVKATI